MGSDGLLRLPGAINKKKQTDGLLGGAELQLCDRVQPTVSIGLDQRHSCDDVGGFDFRSWLLGGGFDSLFSWLCGGLRD